MFLYMILYVKSCLEDVSIFACVYSYLNNLNMYAHYVSFADPRLCFFLTPVVLLA